MCWYFSKTNHASTPWNTAQISIFENMYWLEYTCVKLWKIIKWRCHLVKKKSRSGRHHLDAACSSTQELHHIHRGKQETCSLSHLLIEQLRLTYGDIAQHKEDTRPEDIYKFRETRLTLELITALFIVSTNVQRFAVGLFFLTFLQKEKKKNPSRPNRTQELR